MFLNVGLQMVINVRQTIKFVMFHIQLAYHMIIELVSLIKEVFAITQETDQLGAIFRILLKLVSLKMEAIV